ncbi:pilus assembly protein PilZ [Filobacillus milosensis]|uniref:Pilus assembly protein PilZ n=1 Tax=Filobacillus milosensis TaxID=94137 RepID=A0A4Y8IQK2_9BACI|nr:flagellar brake domain-containing protein [Filobacillus milosensis]TFB23952.1 pilus assembly protein PilZ [Filobacillus milosensis]
MLKVGMKLTIETFKNGEVEDRFQCKVAEMTKNNIYIDYPINERTGRTALFMDGSEFKVSYVADDGNVYVFSSEIVGRKKIKIPVLAIRVPLKSEVRKIQRRQYVRVDVSLDVAIHPVDDEKPSLITRTVDISGGGIAVIGSGLEKGYQSGDIMKLTIVLPFQSNDYNFFTSDAEVIRCIAGTDASSPKITYKFVNVDEKQREKIIKYCFEKQLEKRRKVLNK